MTFSVKAVRVDCAYMEAVYNGNQQLLVVSGTEMVVTRTLSSAIHYDENEILVRGTGNDTTGDAIVNKNGIRGGE